MFRPSKDFSAFIVCYHIVAMLLAFYAGFFAVVALLDCIFNVPFSSQQIFNYRFFSFKFKIAIFAILGEFVGGFLSAVVFSHIEGRHRRALDFVSTTYITYLLATWASYGFPLSSLWWITIFLSMLLSFISARKISLHYELQDIAIEPFLIETTHP